MNEAKQRLILAEQKAKELFYTVEEKGLIVSGKSEKALCDEAMSCCPVEAIGNDG